ncbi:hypothetical protein HYALB_00006981 [Hymenoscyphus albidus]|uniref:Uncharacterized protein n=1 Tax=Hymenoscyphus albidus TaxID=595503 RepID=A0A9N9PZB6_9HELO|nr:hypothetical protein HYALB_00006981 [Hymenoscyphus albidus]
MPFHPFSIPFYYRTMLFGKDQDEEWMTRDYEDDLFDYNMNTSPRTDKDNLGGLDFRGDIVNGGRMSMVGDDASIEMR